MAAPKLMKPFLNIAWLTCLVFIGVSFSPVEPFVNWDEVEGNNPVLGQYTQSTGLQNFHVDQHKIDHKLLYPDLAIVDIKIVGNIPELKYPYTTHYEIMSSKFILTGHIAGVASVDEFGEYYIYQVEEYYLTRYVPTLWRYNGTFMVFLGLALITFPVLTVILWMKMRKR